MKFHGLIDHVGHGMHLQVVCERHSEVSELVHGTFPLTGVCRETSDRHTVLAG